ncbi:MAG TPA: hypothetical protein ENH82_03515 [bacterium]|nr:hypothetical protein [bacterium]
MMRELYKRLFWKKVYSYRDTSRLENIKQNERVISMTMAYHNSYPAGMQREYLIESVRYEKP